MRTHGRNFFIVCSVLYFIFKSFSFANAAPDPSGETGRIAVVNGEVFVVKEADIDAAGKGRKAQPNDPIYNDDVIKTQASSSAKILFSDQSIMDLGPNSALKVSDYSLKDGDNRSGSFQLFYGKLRSLITKKVGPQGKVEIKTSDTVMGVRGTEFIVQSSGATTQANFTPTTVLVVEGMVNVQAPQGGGAAMNISSGQMLTTSSTTFSSAGGVPATGASAASAGSSASTGGGVQQVSAAQMQTEVSSAKAQDNTFMGSVNLASDSGGSSGTLASISSIVVSSAATMSSTSKGMSDVKPQFMMQNNTMMNFLPQVNIVPGNPVHLSITIQ